MIDTPVPADGEVIVAPRKVGICGTDLQILRGLRTDPAAVLGHEGVAEVVAIGRGVSDFQIGQKVTFNPTNPLDQTDVLGHNVDGLFQQYLLIPRSAIDRGMLMDFNTRLPEVLGALIEPLSAVIYAHSLVQQVLTPQSVAIFGAGSVGLLHALYFKVTADSNSQVFLIHHNRQRLEWASDRRIIDLEQGLLEDANVPDVLLEWTNGHGVDAVFLCTTRPAALTVLRHALKAVRYEGCIDLFGGFADGDCVSELPGVNLNAIRRANCGGLPVPGRIMHTRTDQGKSVWLTGHRGVGANHIHSAMELLTIQPTWFGRVLSHVVSLRAAATLLSHLATGSSRHVNGKEWVKIVIDCMQTGMVINPFDVFCEAQG